MRQEMKVVNQRSVNDTTSNDTIPNNTTSIDSTITAGDIDGNGQDDVIIDYGPGNGIWISNEQ